MPRKKRTRAGRTKLSRTAKTVEKQLEDPNDVSMCSVISEGPSSKEEALAIFLQDFDNQVQKYIKDLRAAAAKCITDQQNLLKMELLKIPKEIRKMKMVDLSKAGGNIDAVIMSEADVLEPAAISVDSLRTHDQENMAPNTAHPATTVKRGGTQRKRTARTVNAYTEATTGRVTRAQLRAAANNQDTPARQFLETATPMLGNSILMSKLPFETPLVAPKFDPRQPVTTGRRPKKGETLMSLAGSPIAGSPQLPGNTSKKSAALIKDGVIPTIMDMSPDSLQNQEEQLRRLRHILDSKIQQIGKEFNSGNSK